MAGRRDKPRVQEPRTNLQRVFMRRVQQEMTRQHIRSRNALTKRVGAPPQTTFNGVMNGADPTLETVSQIAEALGVQAWTLFIEREASEGDSPAPNVVSLPPSPPPIGLGQQIASNKSGKGKKLRR